MLNEPIGVGDQADATDQIPLQTKHRFWAADPFSPVNPAFVAGALCAFSASVLAAPGLSGLLGGGFAVVTIAIAAVDARHLVIPDRLVLAGVALGLIEVSIAPAGPTILSIASCALRAILLAAFFWSFRLTYRWIRGYDGLGLGDVKLAAVAGVWLDWIDAAIAVDIAALSALAFVLIGVARGRKVGRRTMVPFGLFFAPSIWLAWLLAATIMH